MLDEPTNENRRENARTALRQYVEAKGEAYEESSSEVADLITDLLHLTAEIDDREDGPELALNLALTNFNTEQEEESAGRPEAQQSVTGPLPT